MIDGGSNDGTVEILRQRGVKHISESDAGIYHAMNKGIRKASGEIIHILNSDDWYSSNTIVSEMVNLMKEGNYDLCHACVAQVNATGEQIWTIGSNVSKDKLLKKMKVAHPSCFVRASVYEKFGDFSSGFKIAGDYEFILRIWGNVKVGFLRKDIVQMQMDGISNTSPVKSYKESMAIALMHGRGILPSIITFGCECIKHYLIIIMRRFGYKKRVTS